MGTSKELIPDSDEFELTRLRRSASNLYASAKVPVAAAVYGPSQVGKSLFVGRVLVASSDDGRLRLYGVGGDLLRTAKAPGGERPFGVAFAPDGTRIAGGALSSGNLYGTVLEQGSLLGLQFSNPNVSAECGCGESFTV